MRSPKAIFFAALAAAFGILTAFFTFFGVQLLYAALTFTGEGSLGHVGMYMAAVLYPLLVIRSCSCRREEAVWVESLNAAAKFRRVSVSVQRRNIQVRNVMIARIVFLALFISSAAMPQEQGVAKPDPPLVREILQGMPRGEKQEGTSPHSNLKPGDKTPFHTHRFPVTVYVLEGTFTLELEGRGMITVKAGQAMVEPPHVKMTG
jgi:hypothetical protein